MSQAILVLNAGSSSLKFSLVSCATPPTQLLRGHVEGLFTEPHFVARGPDGRVVGDKRWPPGSGIGHAGALEFLFSWADESGGGEHSVVATGHRVVHGGRTFSSPVVVDSAVLSALEKLIALAPLHQPHNLDAIRAALRLAPQTPQIACFDTAFHRTQPRVAQAFGLPRRLTEEGLLRYGFHGLSYEFIASVLATFDERAAVGRTVVAHLGSGASLCALHEGRSVATTMSFTPLDGLLMGTRCGALDPGVLLYLIRQQGFDADRLEALMYEESGLLGVSGISSDLRVLLGSPDPRATEALDLFVYRVVRELGSMAAALGGIDAIVFTAGIGENAPLIRDRICRGAAWLGLAIDPDANEAGGPRITTDESAVSAWVIGTNEELMIANHTRRLVGKGD